MSKPPPKTTGVKSVTQSASKPTSTTKATQSATKPTTQPVTKPTTQSATKPTTQSVTKPTTESVTKPTTQSATKPTTQPVTKPTTQPVTKPTTESVTKPTTQSVTKPTTQSVTKPTTQSVTKPTTQSVTKPTTQSVTKPTTQSATKATPGSGSGFKSTAAAKKPTPQKKAPTGTSESKKESVKDQKINKDVEQATKLVEQVKIEEKKADEITIQLKQIGEVIFDDKTEQIATTKKWPLVVDKNGNVETFMRYRDVNFLDTFNPSDIDPHRIRLAILGAIRFGKEVVVYTHNQLDPMWSIFTEKLNSIHPTLLLDIMSWKIREDDYYKNLIRDEDGDEYKATEFGKSQMYELNKKFKFVLLTNDDVIDKFKSDWLIVTVN